MAKHFVCVADEVYFLYPEDEWNLNRVKNNPDHLLFKKFGTQVPTQEWNKGTKQGTYAMGPQGEYLGAKFAGGDAASIEKLLRGALERWVTLKARNGYAEKAIPEVKFSCPMPDVAAQRTVLRVNLRDLPRGNGVHGARYENVKKSNELWYEFGRWAWNENWIGLNAQETESLIPKSNSWQKLGERAFKRIAREVFVDNVRGQAPHWEEGDVRSVALQGRLTGNGRAEYTGRAHLGTASRYVNLEVYGVAEIASGIRFRSFRMVANGERAGAHQFNNREQDRGPAPIGVSLELFNP